MKAADEYLCSTPSQVRYNRKDVFCHSHPTSTGQYCPACDQKDSEPQNGHIGFELYPVTPHLFITW